MPRFPRKEADIITLAQRIIVVLHDYPAVFPKHPASAFWPDIGLRWKSWQYQTHQGELIAARAAAEQTIADKDEALENLIEAMKSDLRYAENTVDYDDAKLNLIGWAGKKTKNPLAPPGYPRLLEAVKQGDGWVYLDWKAPTDGGTPSAYKVMRRERPAGAWEDVATAIHNEATLVDQPRGVELEYRVIAVNKASEGTESNTVMVVL